MKAMPVLETDRLLVRPFRLDEFEAVYQMFDEQIYSPGWPREIREEWLQWCARNPRGLELVRQPPYGDRAVTLKDGTLVGSAGIVPYFIPLGQLSGFGRNENALSQAEVGLYWAFAPAHRRKGYATEAARALVEHLFRVERLNRVIADTSYDNVASQGVMRRLGMRLERNPFKTPEWLQVVGILENDVFKRALRKA